MATVLPHAPLGAPLTLRIFEPSDHPEQSDDSPVPNANWTLSQVFERAFITLWIKPQALTGSTETLYRDAVEWWIELTGDPPLCEITDYTTASFAALLLEQPGRKREKMAIGTVRKHCTQIDKLLSFVGPRTRDKQGRKNLGLLALPPMVDKPTADGDPPAGDFTMDEVRAMFAACDQMIRPRIDGVTPAAWWRALLVVACYTGLRIGQIMRLEYSDLKPPYITVWGRSSKGRKGKRQFLHPEALADIQAIRTERTRIFEFPRWDTNPRWLQVVLKRLLAAAGLPEERWFAFHGFRKLHATLVADQDDSAGILAAQLSLGHSSSAVTTGHYINGRVQDKIAAAAIQKLPSPKGKHPDDPRQKRLFDT